MYPQNPVQGQQIPGQQQQTGHTLGYNHQQVQQQQQPMQGQQQVQQQNYNMDYFRQDGFEVVSDGDRNPLTMGLGQRGEDMLPGEQIEGVIQTVHHGASKWQGQGEAKPYAAIQLRILNARNNKALINQAKTLFLRGQYLDNFYAAKWGINDTLSVGYGGKQDTGRGMARNLLYLQGRKANNSTFVPRQDDGKEEEIFSQQAIDAAMNQPMQNNPPLAPVNQQPPMQPPVAPGMPLNPQQPPQQPQYPQQGQQGQQQPNGQTGNPGMAPQMPTF